MNKTNTVFRALDELTLRGENHDRGVPIGVGPAGPLGRVGLASTGV